MATYPRVPTQNNQQYTLDSQLAQGGTSLTLNQSVASVIQAPGYGWIDRVDSSGSLTPTKREYFYFTGVSGADLTGLTRGVAGSTDQVHAVGAIVEFGPNVSEEGDKYSVFTQEHTVNGVHASLPSITYIKTSTLLDASSAEIRASGASLTGVNAIRPVWFIPGTASAATTSIGSPVPMPSSGTANFVSITLRSPVSSASLIFDINKNFVSIFDSGTRPSILGGGTFVSTASILTKSFIGGDIYSVDLDQGGNYADATVMVNAR